MSISFPTQKLFKGLLVPRLQTLNTKFFNLFYWWRMFLFNSVFCTDGDFLSSSILIMIEPAKKMGGVIPI